MRVLIARAVLVGIVTALVGGGVAQAATTELSVNDRLQDRREVTSGTRAFAVGFEDGRWYANGWHIAGEMGGVWTPPLKLVDGVWFAVDDQWVPQATRFTSGWGYTRYEFPDTAGLEVQRTDFAPDDQRAFLLGLELTNPSAARRTVTVKVHAHSELMGAYPWGFSGVTPHASDNIADQGSFTGRALRFTDDGALRSGGPAHRYAAMVGSDRRPVGGTAAATGGDFRGPQGDHACQDGDTSPPSACDDGPFGNGTGGELRYRVSIAGGASETLWIAVAGSDNGQSEAQASLNQALNDPGRRLARKIAERQALGRLTQVDLPGDRRLQDAIDWGKQNLADSTQEARNLRIVWTDQGRQFPPPLGTVDKARWFGAGFPDYPWIFATDGEYTNFAAVALGQFETAKDHLRALRDISEVLNDRSGIVVHESVSDGSIWFGHDSQRTNPDSSTTNNFNTDETVKFPSAVALVWRWTGDRRFLHEMYDFARRTMQVTAARLDEDGDGWPEGSGNVERAGMGEEKLDNAVYYVRSLFDLADMARSVGDHRTARNAESRARDLRSRFDRTWWNEANRQYADSLVDPGNVQSFQKHWIGSVPMEAELAFGRLTQPGLAPFGHGNTALAERESSCFSGDRPGSLGLYHTGCGGGPEGRGEFAIFSLTTSIQAVGEGNYGRLGPGKQQRYTDANAETMFAEPATGGTPDEQPGAMPEIFPSTPLVAPGQGTPPNIDRCWQCRSMVMQAWGHYGTAWSVVHQHLGVRPFVNDRTLEVVPQVPPGQPSVAGSKIRLGNGWANVFASRSGSTHTTKVDAGDAPVRTLVIGHTLPRGSRATTVRLDGRRVRHHETRQTNRGIEILVRTSARRPHTLTVELA